MASNNKFSLSKLPSASNILSACTFLGATAVLFRTLIEQTTSIVNEIKSVIPQQVRSKLFLLFGRFFPTQPREFTLRIRENNDYISNEIYEASQIYLRTKAMDPSLDQLGVSKNEGESALIFTMEKDQEIVDFFQGMKITWTFFCEVREEKSWRNKEDKYYEVSFLKDYKEIMLKSYLPYVLKTSKAITEEEQALRLYSTSLDEDDDSKGWGSIKLDHPATFETLAMEADMKKKIMDDLDRFVERREFYKRVGKPWKRGYLLYGPPGTGKSSLIAAMANYLHFHIYDLELSSVYSNSEFRKLLLASKNKSILVIEDIDCSVKLTNRVSSGNDSDSDSDDKDSKVTLSGLLNFIDGLWSSCGDERVIVFTSNYKDRLDPALLRPGRMDMHIHMGYCTFCGFKTLANNYLHIESHKLFEEIEILLKDVNATPAELAEKLMKSADPETCLKGVVTFLQVKKSAQEKSDFEDKKKEEASAQVKENGEVESGSHRQGEKT